MTVLLNVLKAAREDVMNWLPDNAEGDRIKARIICRFDTAIEKAGA